ncbi:acyltransferase [Austwickia chelonae]|uniref:acyltransferase n=1 Tax=Austwickia chelonae TaxID=100225 RepID=UPI0003006BC1|nr:acyltransferase [Austwickia chelonae]
MTSVTTTDRATRTPSTDDGREGTTAADEKKSEALRTRVLRLVRTEWKFMSYNALLNSVLGSTLVPRPVRLLGYRLMGLDVKAVDIYPGLKLYIRDGSYLSIGRNTTINHDVMIEATGKVTIEEDVMIGHQVVIITSHHPRLEDGRISRGMEGRPVTLSKDCYIGARALICPGVTIGPKVLIGAGAVVTKDCLEPGATYVGIPARKLG